MNMQAHTNSYAYQLKALCSNVVAKLTPFKVNAFDAWVCGEIHVTNVKREEKDGDKDQNR